MKPAHPAAPRARLRASVSTCACSLSKTIGASRGCSARASAKRVTRCGTTPRGGGARERAALPSYTGAGAEIERLAAALSGMLARIEHAVAGLSRCTADAAHELRTPLATLMSRLEISLRHPRSAADLRATIEVSPAELARLARLVDTLLTLSRCDAGALLPACTGTDLGELVAEVCASYEALASERGLTLVLAPTGGDARARAAPLLLRQALYNLLDNACKFTPPGGAIGVAIVPAGAALEVRVQDSGPGFTAEEAQRAFERFYRSERMRAATEGFGIGLPLARELVRAQGGELTLRPVARGACLVVSLPRSPECLPAPAATGSPDPRSSPPGSSPRASAAAR